MAKATPKRWQRFITDEVHDALRQRVNHYWFRDAQEVEDQVFKDAEDILVEAVGEELDVSITSIEEALAEMLNDGAELLGSEFTPTVDTSTNEIVLDHQLFPLRIRFSAYDLSGFLRDTLRHMR